MPLSRLVRMAMILLAPAIALRPLSAQQAGPLGTKDGDTVNVVIHHVPAAKRADYERWMQTVWWTAAKNTGAKYPEWRRAYAERRRFIPTDRSTDTTLTYVFIYPYGPKEGPKVKRPGVGAALESSGMADDDVDRELKEFHALGVKTESATLVQREYR